MKKIFFSSLLCMEMLIGLAQFKSLTYLNNNENYLYSIDLKPNQSFSVYRINSWDTLARHLTTEKDSMNSIYFSNDSSVVITETQTVKKNISYVKDFKLFKVGNSVYIILDIKGRNDTLLYGILRTLRNMFPYHRSWQNWVP